MSVQAALFTPFVIREPAVGRFTYLIAVLILCAAPAAVFVVGFDPKRWKPDYMYTPTYHADYAELLKRVAFWFSGLVVCYVVLHVSYTIATQSS